MWYFIFRLTPSIIALLVFTIVFVPKIGSGGRWDYVMNLFITNCRTKWWPHLLFVQNFVDQDNIVRFCLILYYVLIIIRIYVIMIYFYCINNFELLFSV